MCSCSFVFVDGQGRIVCSSCQKVHFQNIQTLWEKWGALNINYEQFKEQRLEKERQEIVDKHKNDYEAEKKAKARAEYERALKTVSQYENSKKEESNG